MKDRLCTSEMEFTPPACLALLCLVDKIQDLNFGLRICKSFAKNGKGVGKICQNSDDKLLQKIGRIKACH